MHVHMSDKYQELGYVCLDVKKMSGAWLCMSLSQQNARNLVTYVQEIVGCQESLIMCVHMTAECWESCNISPCISRMPGVMYVQVTVECQKRGYIQVNIQ